VHQFIPSFVTRDAIGFHAMQVHSVLRDMGLRSEFYVRDASAERQHLVRPYESYRSRPGEWLLYQASTGSVMGEWLLGRPEPKLVNYHNVTPASFFEAWEPWLCDEVSEGRRQIEKLASVTTHAIAVSRYNQAELTAAGYRSTSVAPLMLDLGDFEHEADRPTLEWMRRASERGGANFVFVGRIVPNKAQHDLIKALVAYRRLYDPEARLYLVGGGASPAYQNALKRFAGALGLRGAVDFAGSVSDAERSAYYRGADAFVCLSDHEGFGGPLLEAMHAGVPVVAYGSSAIPETVGDAALVLADKHPAVVAAALWKVVSDQDLRQRLVEAGRRRLAQFSLERTRAAFRAAMEQALAAGATAGASR